MGKTEIDTEELYSGKYKLNHCFIYYIEDIPKNYIF